MKTTSENYLARAALLRLLAVLALVVAPHLWRMPPWIGGAVIAIGLWRAAAALRQWPLPPRWLKVAFVLIAFVTVHITYGRINGQHAGAALLTLMLALKLMEMRSRRDVLIVVSLCYFTMLTHFLFSQELWTILYLLACAVAVTAMLIEASHPGGALRPALTARRSAVLVAQSLPLMLALFVLFPRVPGPLWGLPADAGAARSGIADTMAPGDISQLIQSDEVAFRVRFIGDPPPMKDRYWRGPVLSYFDGQRWRAPFRGDSYFQMAGANPYLNAYRPARVDAQDRPIQYEVTLEPHRQNWMFALDVPDRDQLPPNAVLSGYYQLLSRELVKDRLRYQAVSYTRYRLEPELEDQWQRSAQRLPEDRNPRAIALARQWRAEGLQGTELIDRALRMFREEPFHYTLEPPPLGTDMVDEFLFGTRRGFCEHYASSFTVLMRAAGLPARVVVGYMGGEHNAVGDYYVVRQSDAHAWSEVWLPGRGWLRVDPTAAVAPSRVETGITGALASEELPDFLRREGRGFWYWRLQAEVAWDWVNVMWDRWVLGFTPDRQFELLSRFGLDDWQDMVLALTGLITALLGLVGILVLRQMSVAMPADAPLKLWRRATRALAAKGLPQGRSEGPLDYARRIARERPDLAPLVQRLAQAYLDARYVQQQPLESQRELAAAVKALQ